MRPINRDSNRRRLRYRGECPADSFRSGPLDPAIDGMLKAEETAAGN